MRTPPARPSAREGPRKGRTTARRDTPGTRVDCTKDESPRGAGSQRWRRRESKLGPEERRLRGYPRRTERGYVPATRPASPHVLDRRRESLANRSARPAMTTTTRLSACLQRLRRPGGQIHPRAPPPRPLTHASPVLTGSRAVVDSLATPRLQVGATTGQDRAGRSEPIEEIELTTKA